MTGRREDNAVRGLVIAASPYLAVAVAILVMLWIFS